MTSFRRLLRLDFQPILMSCGSQRVGAQEERYVLRFSSEVNLLGSQ